MAKYLWIAASTLILFSCQQEKSLTLLFSDVNGLNQGAQVMDTSGNNIGVVSQITLLKDYRVAVTIRPLRDHSLPCGAYEIIATGPVKKVIQCTPDPSMDCAHRSAGDTVIGIDEQRLSVEETVDLLIQQSTLGLDTSASDSLLKSLQNLKDVLDSAEKSEE